MPSKNTSASSANSKAKPVYLNAPYKTTKQTIPAKKRSISSDHLVEKSSINVKQKQIEPIQALASLTIEAAQKIPHTSSNDQIISKPFIKKFTTVSFIYVFIRRKIRPIKLD